MAFLFILPSGAGGYIAADNEHEARDRVSYLDGQGWIFHCEFAGSRYGEKLVQLRLVSTLGCPKADRLAAALDAAGRRHGAVYELLD